MQVRAHAHAQGILTQLSSADGALTPAAHADESETPSRFLSAVSAATVGLGEEETDKWRAAHGDGGRSFSYIISGTFLKY